MFTVYILYSETHDKTYTGFTSDIASRFQSHNELATKGWTIRYRPWKLIHTEEYATKAEAMKREKWFKTGIGRDYIREVILGKK